MDVVNKAAGKLGVGSPGVAAGLGHVWRGFGLLRAPGVRAYVIGPLLINVVLFVLALGGVGHALDYAIDSYLANWPEWLQSLVWVLFAVLAAVVVFLSFSVVANLVASPFNGLLAEAVERHLRGDPTPVKLSPAALLAELARTLGGELRKLLYIVLRALPLLVLSVIPGLNVIAGPLWLLFGAWMLCMDYLDCPLGNHGEVFPRVLQTMRQRRRLALGFGFGMTAITVVPVLNFIAVPLGVAAATSLYCAHLAHD